MATKIHSVKRARNLPVFVGIVVLGVTIAGAARSHAAVSSHQVVSSTLSAFVHDDATIGLSFADGSPVGSQGRVPPTIPAGTYTINVVDDAYEHNFHLTGPGVDLTTDVDGVSSPTWTVTFQPGGSYRFQCDAHPDFMWGAFIASGTAAASGSASSSGSSSSSGSGTSSSGLSSGSSTSSTGNVVETNGKGSLAGTLAATLNAAGKVALTRSGIPVAKLKAGRYQITIRDTSKTHKFVLQQKGHAAKALSSATTLSLTAGTWLFYSSGAKTKRSFTVSG